MIYNNNAALNLPAYKRKSAQKKVLEGVDLFVDWTGTNPNELADKLKSIESENIGLTMMTNRGIKVWPNGFDETFCTDHWRCRFTAKEGAEFNKESIIQLLQNATDNNIDAIKTENLYAFDGKAGYSLGQGQ